jgi:LacI family transcriptional regulator
LGENSYQGGYQAAGRLLSLPSPPTAIFATDDRIAIGALSAALDMGRTIPGDLSIVGFDDMDVSAYVRPALTTIRQPMEQIARKAVELLLEMIKANAAPDPVPQFLMEPELVVRDSCAPPAQALSEERAELVSSDEESHATAKSGIVI